MEEDTALCKLLHVVCLFALMAGACQGRYQNPEDLMKEGRMLLASGNPGGAILLMKKALDKDQNNYEARLTLAKAYSLAGKTDSAEKELQKLTRQRPNDRAIRVEMARLQVYKNRPAEALKTLQDIDSADGDSDIYEIRAVAYALKNDIPAALAAFNKALETGGPRTSVLVSLARVYAQVGRYDEAKVQIERARTQDPTNRKILGVLVDIQDALGDIDGALRTCDAALKAAPDDISVLYRKGLLYQKQGHYQNCIALAEKIIALSPNRPEGHRLKGINLFHQKHTADALASLQKSLALSPQPSVSDYYYLALVHFERNEAEQAAGKIQQALDIMPSFGQGRALLALILLKKNRNDDALNEARKAVAQDEDNAFAYNVLGSVCLAKGLFDEGVGALSRAIALDPSLVDAHIKKGLFHIKRGSLAEGETLLNMAVRINPEMLNSRMVLSSYYQRRGNYDKAINILASGLKGSGSDAVLYTTMADIHLRNNRIAEAMESYRKSCDLSQSDDYACLRIAAMFAARGEVGQGIQTLEKVLQRMPTKPRALSMLAILYEASGREDDAVKCYKRARLTGQPEAFIEEARYWLRKKNHDRAVDRIKEALAKYPSNRTLHELKGNIHVAQREFGPAIKEYEELARLDPKSGLERQIAAYLEMGNYQKALDRINSEIRKAPDRLELKAERSRIYLRMGKHQEAADNAREIIQTAPEAAAGYLALAGVHRSEKNITKGIEVLRNAKAKDASLHLMLGGLYALKQEYAAAMSECKKVGRMKADYAPALFQEGAVLQAMGRKNASAAAYRRALALNPNYAPALNNLAYLYAEEKGEQKKALHYAVRAYLLAPEDGAVNDTLGYVLLKNGKIDAGLKALKTAAALIPGDASVHYHLGLAYYGRGDRDLAIESLRKAVDMGCQDPGKALGLINKLEKEKRS